MTGDDDPRVERIVRLLARLGAGDLEVHEPLAGLGDGLDAILVAAGGLAEELAASRAGVDRRLRDQAVEVRLLDRTLSQLSELGSLLQTCSSRDEAYAVLRRDVEVVFDGLSGRLYSSGPERGVYQLALFWGSGEATPTLRHEDCWALRRSQAHLTHRRSLGPPCRHVPADVEQSLCVPVQANGGTVGLLHLVQPDVTTSGRRQITHVTHQVALALASQTGASLANIDLREDLQGQALHDPLTGLFNRRFVEEWVGRETSRARRSGGTIGVIVADLDRFKEVNDRFGHPAGDAVLVAVGETLRTWMRAGDVPCRYGGEEFLVLINDITLPELTRRTEQLRAAVADLVIEVPGLTLPPLTISAGVALFPDHGESVLDAVHAADRALYVAKNAGRDRVSAADRATEPSL